MGLKTRLELKGPLLKQIDELREKLHEADETLSAIRSGAVDAIVVEGPQGARQVFTLKGADQPYRVLVENMNEGALTLSDQGVILYCNARMAVLAGRSLERMMGRKFTELLVEGAAPAFMRLLDAARGPRKITVRLRPPADGTHAQLSLTPIDLEGTRAFCVIATDLTEAFAVRQAMLQTDAGLRLLAQASPAILFTADAHGRVLSITGAALKKIDRRVDELLSAPAAGTRRPVPARTLLGHAAGGEKVSYDVRYANRLWSVQLEQLGIGAVIGIAVDITGERPARPPVMRSS